MSYLGSIAPTVNFPQGVHHVTVYAIDATQKWQSTAGLSKCGLEAAAGCADGMTIYALGAVIPHEIVHVNASLIRQPPPSASEIRQAPALFAEGLAEVLSCGNTADERGLLEMSEPLESLVETEAFDSWRDANGFGLYVTSASFVRFLIDNFGLSPFLSFYARAPRDGSRQKIDNVFQSELGVSLDEAFSAWRKEPRPYLGDLCLRLMECDPSMPSLTDTDATLGCGPWGGYGINEALLRFEVPNHRLLHITIDPIAADPYYPSRVSFYRCAGGDAIGTFTQASNDVGDSLDRTALPGTVVPRTKLGRINWGDGRSAGGSSYRLRQ